MTRLTIRSMQRENEKLKKHIAELEAKLKDLLTVNDVQLQKLNLVELRCQYLTEQVYELKAKNPQAEKNGSW